MNKIDLRNLLIHRISKITIKSNIPLTPEQKEEIRASKKEISMGLYFEEKNIETEVAAWLNEE